MLHDILVAIWVFLPAGAANVAPIVAAKYHWTPGLARPVDGGATWRGYRLFGEHKTWRGLLFGFIAACIVVALQAIVASQNATLRQVGIPLPIEYSTVAYVMFVGGLFTLGALGGDMVESFFKRQRGIKSGHAWAPFDQIDYIIGASIAIAPLIVLSLSQYIWAVAIWCSLHLIMSYAGWRLSFKKTPI